jgi:hypothetical protein
MCFHENENLIDKFEFQNTNLNLNINQTNNNKSNSKSASLNSSKYENLNNIDNKNIVDKEKSEKSFENDSNT